VTRYPIPLLLCVALLLCTSSGVCAFKYVQVGMLAPDAKLVTLEGEQVDAADLAGERGTIMLFWALWSARSMEQLLDLSTRYDSLAASGIEVIAVSVDKSTFDGPLLASIRRVREDQHIRFPMLVDPGLRLFYAYGVVAAPSSAVLDPQQRVVYSLAGYSLSAADTMVRTTYALLGLGDDEVPLPEFAPLGKVHRFFGLGVRLYRRGDASSALTYLRQAGEHDSTFAPLQYYIGLASEQAGDRAAADRAFAKATASDPANPVYQTAWAGFRMREGDTLAAEQMAQTALETDSTYVDARALLARIHLARLDWAGAEEQLHQGLAVDSENLVLILLNASRLTGQGDTARALDQFRRGLAPRLTTR